MFKGGKILALITARGGSKRLPSKNTTPMGGKPLITWSIEAAKKSRYIDTVMVSTDDDNIAQVALKNGAEVPFMRPKELASDTATSLEVVFHVIDYLKQKKEDYKYLVLLQPTSPLRTYEDIENAIERLTISTKAVVSVCETEHSPLWSNTLPDDLSMAKFIRDEVKNIRSQDLPKYYRLNGALYLAEIDFLIENKGFFGEQTKAYIMPISRSIDIDTEIDFILAGILLNRRR
jgi:CMP-N-acetylneuraminic acid synthetase